MANPKAKILVIDDEEIVHESLKRILEPEGYEVEGELSALEGLKRLGSETYEMVITDLKMPGMTGMEAIEAIKRDKPEVGVIMITGYSTVESAVEAIKLGAFDYLQKPFTPEELIETVQISLEKRRKYIEDEQLKATFEEASKAISSTLDLTEVLGLIASSVVRLTKAKGSVIYLLDKGKNRLEPFAYFGLSERYIKKGPIDSDRSIAETLSGKHTLIEDAPKDPRIQYPKEAEEEGIVSILSIPMKKKDEVIGSLRVYTDTKRSFTEEDIQFLYRFAEQGAVAVENALAYKGVIEDIDGLRKGLPQHLRRNQQ